MEGLGFRDRILEFEARDAQVLGISADSVEANAAFAQRYGFPFPMLSDTTRRVCAAYGACDSADAGADRVTFVIGPDGRILRVYEDVWPSEHADEILQFLDELPGRDNVAGSAGNPGNNGKESNEIVDQGSVMDVIEPDSAGKSGSEETNPNEEIEMLEPGSVGANGPEEIPTRLSTSDVQFAERMPPGPADAAPRRMAPSAGMPLVPENAPQVRPGQALAGQNGAELPLVYFIGIPGIDFGTEARRDSFAQLMPGQDIPNPPDPANPVQVPGNPNDMMQLIDYLDANHYETTSLIWTLSLDNTPIYALEPSGAFASLTYDWLRQFLRSTLEQEIQRVSVPGIISGSARLFSGQVVPLVVPEIRGMYSWSTGALASALLEPPPDPPPEGAPPAVIDAYNAALNDYNQRREAIENFMNRIYYAMRNLGRTSQDRAMNYAGTNAYQAVEVLTTAQQGGLELDTISAEPSPFCRPDSDCWDVVMTFFNPQERLTVARRMYRFTVDVSDVMPVSIGPIRSWSLY